MKDKLYEALEDLRKTGEFRFTDAQGGGFICYHDETGHSEGGLTKERALVGCINELIASDFKDYETNEI